MTAPDHFADTFNKTLASRERPHMTTPVTLPARQNRRDRAPITFGAQV
jgi:hypothetical protein